MSSFENCRLATFYITDSKTGLTHEYRIGRRSDQGSSPKDNTVCWTCNS